MSDSPKPWCLYVLRCADGTLYCGITNDLARRLDLHNRGAGARYTRGRGPLVLLRSWPAKNMSAALKAEAAFKALRRPAKDRFLTATLDLLCDS
ncbi:MAG: GIY-YIG nuclease family protein [Prosthecobacter sp.]|nr:GIY-YIG nuclease family protein [Prosthecobacter sp.]